MSIILIQLMLIISATHFTYGYVCEVNSTVDGVSQYASYKTCPGESDPDDFTKCCYFKINSTGTDAPEGPVLGEFEGLRCCPGGQQPILFNFISDQSALIIAICSTISLLVVTVVVVVCCFWSKCPFYMMCRIKYRKEDIIAYDSKDEETLNLHKMPPEEQKGIKIYELNAVKVTMKEDLA